MRGLGECLCRTSLLWVEVDFAPILDYKHNLLKDVRPQCRLERMTADLNEKAERQRVLDAMSGRVLLLTEGLLFYLPAETVRGLAADAADGCYRWILDIAPQTAMLLQSGGESMRRANELRSETRLEGVEILELLPASGWAAVASRTFAKDGAAFAVRRMAKNGWTPDPSGARLPHDDPSGVWMFGTRG